MSTLQGSPIVVMGVSGSGKSTVGAALAQRLRVPFADADDFHPAANVAKIRPVTRSTTMTATRGSTPSVTGSPSTAAPAA